MKRNDSDLFFLCSLIEYIGRETKLERKAVVAALDKETMKRIYKYAGTFHCEPMEKVAYDFIDMRNIPNGNFDNVSECEYEVPDYWTIGEVYARLIEDVGEEDVIESVCDVYNSMISRAISNYNSDFYYQPRDYIAECFREGRIL